MQERRSEVRMLCADVVEVSWKDEKGRKRKATGLLEDISASGACLQLETPVPMGAAIRWDCPKQPFTGTVQYCVYREIGYFVGVEFDPTTKWSKRRYRPQHLLDLSQLVAVARK
jgi:PilZ domain